MGLMLFQLLPALQEVLSRGRRGGRALAVAAWWSFLVRPAGGGRAPALCAHPFLSPCPRRAPGAHAVRPVKTSDRPRCGIAWRPAQLVTVPLCVVSLLALYRPQVLGMVRILPASACLRACSSRVCFEPCPLRWRRFDASLASRQFLEANAKGAFPPAVSRFVDGVMKALGAMRGPDDPWRTLGVARNADAREIKKKVRELSLVRAAPRPSSQAPGRSASASDPAVADSCPGLWASADVSSGQDWEQPPLGDEVPQDPGALPSVDPASRRTRISSDRNLYSGSRLTPPRDASSGGRKGTLP